MPSSLECPIKVPRRSGVTVFSLLSSNRKTENLLKDPKSNLSELGITSVISEGDGGNWDGPTRWDHPVYYNSNENKPFFLS